ncbi:MAG: acyl-ACP--UDP-N-acetylglucosamine O-acyltransferase [Deltaproteobacteria bacterium]|nr:MAG: acyl-ACP--UDP-N-acetylglucosamine O-acyltransferase [Deltaproteobacteria bacterium]
MAIHPTAIIDPQAELAASVDVGPYAIIGPGVVLHDDVIIGAHAVVTGPTVIGARTRVHPHAVLGEDPQDKKYAGEDTRLIIGEDNVFREFSTANRGTVQGGGETRIGDGNLFMAYSHVAHDCLVGSHCVFANCASLAGHVEIQDGAVLGGLSGVHQFTRVGRCAMVGGGGMVAQDVPPFTIAQGDRARLFGLNIVGLRRNGYRLPTIQALRAVYRELFNQGTPLRIALEQVREVYADTPEVMEMVDFIETSRRGVCRAVGPEPAIES